MTFDQGAPFYDCPLAIQFYKFLTRAIIDGNGTITPLELQNLMESLLGDVTLNEEINTIIRSVDADGSGTIEFDEFVAFMSDPRFKDPTKDEHREVFEMFDKDGSGRIDIAELKEAFKNIG